MNALTGNVGTVSKVGFFVIVNGVIQSIISVINGLLLDSFDAALKFDADYQVVFDFCDKKGKKQ